MGGVLLLEYGDLWCSEIQNLTEVQAKEECGGLERLGKWYEQRAQEQAELFWEM